MELFVALHWKPLTFGREFDLRKMLACNLDPRSSSKIWFYNYCIDIYFHKLPLIRTRWQLLAPSEFFLLPDIVIKGGYGLPPTPKIQLKAFNYSCKEFDFRWWQETGSCYIRYDFIFTIEGCFRHEWLLNIIKWLFLPKAGPLPASKIKLFVTIVDRLLKPQKQASCSTHHQMRTSNILSM